MPPRAALLVRDKDALAAHILLCEVKVRAVNGSRSKKVRNPLYVMGIEALVAESILTTCNNGKGEVGCVVFGRVVDAERGVKGLISLVCESKEPVPFVPSRLAHVMKPGSSLTDIVNRKNASEVFSGM